MEGIQFKRLELSDVENVIIEYNKDSLKKIIENKENYIFAGINDNKAITFLYGYGMLRPDGKRMFIYIQLMCYQNIKVKV